MAVALAAADTYVVVLALTDMMAGVGLGVDALQKATPIVSGFLVGYICVLPLVGRLADLVDRRRVLLACLAIFVVGSGLTALAVELPVLVTGRVFQGVGGGGLVPATLAIVASSWPPDRRGLPLGVVGAVQEVGSVLGPVLGALILAVWDWRAIFWVGAALGIVLVFTVIGVDGRWRLARPSLAAISTATGLAVLGLALAAPEPLVTSITLGIPFVPFGQATSRLATPVGTVALGLLLAAFALSVRRWLPVLRRADLPGALLLGGALGCVVVTFAAADPAKEVVGAVGGGLLPAAVVLGILYAVRHRRAAEPLIARGLVRGRAAWALAVSACVGVALVAIVVDVPLLARLLLSDTVSAGAQVETEAALVLVRFLIAVPIGALVGGWLLRWVGDGLVAAPGLALTCGAMLAMTGWGRGAFDAPSATLVLVLAGLGLGLTLAPVNNAALASAGPSELATVSSLVVVARMVGMVVGLALLTAIGLRQYYSAVAELPDRTDPVALVDAAILQVHGVFQGAALVAGVGAVAALRLGWVRRRA